MLMSLLMLMMLYRRSVASLILARRQHACLNTFAAVRSVTNFAAMLPHYHAVDMLFRHAAPPPACATLMLFRPPAPMLAAPAVTPCRHAQPPPCRMICLCAMAVAALRMPATTICRCLIFFFAVSMIDALRLRCHMPRQPLPAMPLTLARCHADADFSSCHALPPLILRCLSMMLPPLSLMRCAILIAAPCHYYTLPPQRLLRATRFSLPRRLLRPYECRPMPRDSRRLMSMRDITPRRAIRHMRVTCQNYSTRVPDARYYDRDHHACLRQRAASRTRHSVMPPRYAAAARHASDARCCYINGHRARACRYARCALRCDALSPLRYRAAARQYALIGYQFIITRL